MSPPATRDDAGRVLDDRYRLVARIGSGARTTVYAADDLESGMQVAVKLLDPTLAEDEAFDQKFDAFAEQAASLDHPNIVALHDWGRDEGPYVVTEMCAGGSLRDLIQAGGRLTASQALVVALESARALEYAHLGDVVHRYLRPSNILFLADQRLKIADFGIARLVAEAPAASPDDALRSVRYVSPEQARGRPVTERSDIYSLALTITEAVTGRPPQVAETVVGTLMARAEAPALSSDDLAAVRGPLERAGRVDPAERPEAGELVIGLLAAAETMSRPSALPLALLSLPAPATTDVAPVPAEPIDAGVDAEAPRASSEARLEGTEDIGTAPEVDGAATASDASSDSEFDPPGPDDEPDPFDEDVDFDAVEEALDVPLDDDLVEAPGVGDELGAEFLAGEERAPLRLVQSDLVAERFGLDQVAEAEPVFASVPSEPVFAAAPEPEPELDVPVAGAEPGSGLPTQVYEEDDDDLEDRLPRWPLLVLAVLVAGVLGAGAFFYFGVDAQRVNRVPDLTGVDVAQLDDLVGDFDWEIELLEGRLDGSSAGAIIAQRPDPGSTLDEGGVLEVTVSLGNAMVEIPSDLIGLTVAQAEARLGSVGLALGSIVQENNETLASGLVIGIDEPTTQKPSGRTVSLRVSLGPEARVVPEALIGMEVAEAVELLSGLRLQAVQEPVFDPAAAEGTVLGADPLVGVEVQADSVITLFISAGPEPVEMPDVTDLALDEAIDLIESLGLIFVNTEGTPGEPAIGTEPPAGEVVDVGTEVVIILDEPEEDPDAEDESDG